MAERGFTEADVEYCLDHVLSEDRDRKGHRRCNSLLRDGRGIRVVLDDAAVPNVVITVIWVRR